MNAGVPAKFVRVDREQFDRVVAQPREYRREAYGDVVIYLDRQTGRSFAAVKDNGQGQAMAGPYWVHPDMVGV